MRRPVLFALLAGVAVLWTVDAWIASASSPAFTAALVRTLNDHASVRITVRRARLHPIFLFVEAEGIELFDAAAPGTRVLYAARATARPALLSWLRGRRDLSQLSLEKAHLYIVKDLQGVFNWERVARLEPVIEEPAEALEPLFGWKYQDWFFDLYERLRRAVHQDHDARPQAMGTRIRISNLRLRGRAVLTDRFMTPLVVKPVEIRLGGLQWLNNGVMELDAASARGVFGSESSGRFSIRFVRRGEELRGTVRLHHVNLEPLLPLYANSSPVLFEKGFLTLHSEMRLTTTAIASSHRLRLNDHQIRPMTTWSPESSAVIHALNRHPVLDLQFTVTGHPNHPSFAGVVESLTKILAHDFEPYTLSLIRLRLQQELDRVSLRFGS